MILWMNGYKWYSEYRNEANIPSEIYKGQKEYYIYTESQITLNGLPCYLYVATNPFSIQVDFTYLEKRVDVRKYKKDSDVDEFILKHQKMKEGNIKLLEEIKEINEKKKLDLKEALSNYKSYMRDLIRLEKFNKDISKSLIIENSKFKLLKTDKVVKRKNRVEREIQVMNLKLAKAFTVIYGENRIYSSNDDNVDYVPAILDYDSDELSSKVIFGNVKIFQFPEFAENMKHSQINKAIADRMRTKKDTLTLMLAIIISAVISILGSSIFWMVYISLLP